MLLVGAALLVGGADVVASATTTHNEPSRQYTIRIVTTLGSTAVNSAGLGGGADVIEFGSGLRGVKRRA